LDIGGFRGAWHLAIFTRSFMYGMFCFTTFIILQIDKGGRKRTIMAVPFAAEQRNGWT